MHKEHRQGSSFTSYAALVIASLVAVLAAVFYYYLYDPTPSQVISIRPVVPNAILKGEKRGLTAIVLGGTGEIGRHVVRELVESPFFGRVISLQRRQVDFLPKNNHSPGAHTAPAKLQIVIIDDFDRLDSKEYSKFFIGADVAFNAFGTTRREAGGAENFHRIDLGYSAKFAQQCKAAGVERVHLITSVGANQNSMFLYPQVKGKLEELYRGLKFRSLSIWRPGLLDRSSPRFVEKLALYFMSGMPVSRVGLALVIRAEQQQQLESDSEFVEILTDKDINKITSN